MKTSFLLYIKLKVLLAFLIMSSVLYGQNNKSLSENENQDALNKNSYSVNEFTDTRNMKIYKSVKIGDQIWMAEDIAYDAGEGSWMFNDEESHLSSNVWLYNWETASKVCPDNWHLPTDEEWKKMEIFIGMCQNEANNTNWRGTNQSDILKKASGWYNNGNGVDKFGFSGLPGGYRSNSGNFKSIGNYGYWWTSTEYSESSAWGRHLNYTNTSVFRNHLSKDLGFSVRCVKD